MGESIGVGARALSGQLLTQIQLERERKLVEAAQLDREAFAALYDAHFQAIYSYAFHRVGSHAEAEDITAQTFQQALEHLPRYEWRGVPFSAWLYRIAANVIARRYRGVLPRAPLEDAETVADDEREEPPAMVLAAERARLLRAAVERLPPDQQRAIVLKFGRGLRNAEIATLMGRSEGAVKQLVHRALETLRRTTDLEQV